MALALAGVGGTVFLPGTPNTPVANIAQWDLTVTAQNLDASVLGTYWSIFVLGIRGWNGKLTGQYAVPSDATGQYPLAHSLLNSTSIVVNLQTNPGSGAYEGTCNVTQFDISVPFNGIVSIAFTFVGNGSLQAAD